MATHSTAPDLNEILCHTEVSPFPADYLIADLSPEHPIWSVDVPDGPYPVYCHEIGERVRCPKHPTENHSARTIGMYGEACGVVCDACKAIYTAREFPSNKSLAGTHPEESLTYPDTFVCTGDVTAIMPAGYTLECFEGYYPVWSADFKDGPFTLYSHGVGEEVLCPTHLTQHPPARTIGGECATGIVCDECKTVYAMPSIIPTWAAGEISCIPHDRQDKVILLSVTATKKSGDDSTD